MKKLIPIIDEFDKEESVAIDKIVRIVSWPNVYPNRLRTAIIGAKAEIILVSSESLEVITERINNA